ncbi:MAG: UbiD family decarboxylase [Planctomycetia bacterium]
MASDTIPDLRAFLDRLRARGEVCEVTAEVDARLEVAEIHRRVIAARGPVLLFRNVKGASFPLVTNLFGTPERVALAFGDRPKRFLQDLVHAAETLVPPSLGALWKARGLAWQALKVGTKGVRRGPVTEVDEAPDLSRLPATTSWHGDGGPFFTLPLVCTSHPESGKPNLGMYRMHIHGPDRTGMHFQIGKGGGYHLREAERLGKDLPCTVFLGGPPALILAAIAPLPEDVPEMLLASLVLGSRLPVVRGRGPHAVPAGCELALVGRVLAGVREPEGPFGDHYGYNSLRHDYPVFKVDRVLRRKDMILPATVVGRPRQEDFFLGDYLQELLSPLFPLVMPTVRRLWSYGETGFHSLSAAVVKDRYPREALVSGLRILGEGQLSLTKVLFLTDRDVDLKDFRGLLVTLLERMDFRTDVVVLGHTAMDTLDYAGPMVNKGSKMVWMGLGEKRRSLPTDFTGTLPPGVAGARAFCPGCLVVAGKPVVEDPDAAERLAREPAFAPWPLVLLVDDLEEATRSEELFLWTWFTRFDPARDLLAREVRCEDLHAQLTPPLVVDARMAPSYPEVLEVDAATKALVDRRWDQYGIRLR